MSKEINEYVPTEEDIVRGFRTPQNSTPAKKDGDPFEYMARLLVEASDKAIKDKEAARRGLRKIKADALRDWSKFQEDVLEQHSYAADEKDYEEVNAWTKAIRLYADEVENS